MPPRTARKTSTGPPSILTLTLFSLYNAYVFSNSMSACFSATARASSNCGIKQQARNGTQRPAIPARSTHAVPCSNGLRPHKSIYARRHCQGRSPGLQQAANRTRTPPQTSTARKARRGRPQRHHALFAVVFKTLLYCSRWMKPARSPHSEPKPGLEAILGTQLFRGMSSFLKGPFSSPAYHTVCLALASAVLRLLLCASAVEQ